MHTLEPLCNLEQSLLLKELKFNEPTNHAYCNLNFQEEWQPEPERVSEKHNSYERYISRPTISMVRNWLWEKYKLWMETTKKPFLIKMYSVSYYLPNDKTIRCQSDNPHTAEFECLTEILKHLKNKSND
jgi:hypothetical protein